MRTTMTTPTKSNRGLTTRKRRHCSTSDLDTIKKMNEKDENYNSQNSVISMDSVILIKDGYINDASRNIEEENCDLLTTASLDDDIEMTHEGSEAEKAILCDEELQMPKNPATCKTTMASTSTQRIRFYVEATYHEYSASKYELTNLICQPLPEQTLQRDSLSSGYLADGSKTGSPTSIGCANHIPELPLHLSRMSCASTASSASNIPASAAALVTQTKKRKCVHKDTINKLKKKWKNSELVYSLLERLDQLLGDDKIPHKTNNTRMRTRKRSESNEREDKKKKLKTLPTMPALNEVQGQKVFARWKNRKYYFGHILETLNDNRVKIEYSDKSFNVVNQNHIITDFTLLIGNTVMVSKDGHEYCPGIITSFYVEHSMFKYMVATNNGDFSVDVDNIYFSEMQAKSMRVNQPNVPLIENSFSNDDLRPSCSGTQLAKAKSSLNTSTDSTDSKPYEEGDYVYGCDIETNEPQNLNSSLKLKNLQGKVPKRTNKNEDLLLGPLDIQGEWFTGYNFLLTCSVSPTSKSAEEVHTDSEDFPFSTVPFIHDRLVQQIKSANGRIVQTLEDVKACEYSKTYLITNRPCLTPKYLKCLAFGIKILCHQWIVACTLKRELAPLQELPAGWSIEQSCFINMFERKTSLPLSNLSIRIAQYDNPNFSKFWVHICNALGATTTTFVGTFENTDLIVVEDGMNCPKLTAAYCFGVPLVSSSWIVQTIIHGEARAHTGHPSYNYLYEGSSN